VITVKDQVMGHLRTYHLIGMKGPQVLSMCGGQPKGRHVERICIAQTVAI
jgi:hypothetical protein